MSKPKGEVKDQIYETEVDFLYEVILKAVKAKDELRTFLEDLLTPSEIRMIKRRWHVANLLDEGKSVRRIAIEAGVGTDTVERIAKRLEAGRGGLSKALGLVRGKREQTRKKVEKREDGVQKTPTSPWVFGTRAK